jgi:hypothetical protein
MSFLLPIEYIENKYKTPQTLIKDLELVETVDPSGTPMYDSVFAPRTELARSSSKLWAKYYTDDKAFLKAFVEYARSLNLQPGEADTYAQTWGEFQGTTDFCQVFQYIEFSKFCFLNENANCLFYMSVYSMLSPVMFLLSPLCIVLMPFLLLKIRGIELDWPEYRLVLNEILGKHPIGQLFTDTSTTINQKGYVVMSVVFFCVQLYTNVQSCFLFYKNVNKTFDVLNSTTEYLESTLGTMKELMDKAPKQMQGFKADLARHYAVLAPLHEELKKETWGWQGISKIGEARKLLYALKTDPGIKDSVVYSFGVRGFAENLAALKLGLKHKTINACKFSKTQTSFKEINYPTNPQHKKCSYELENYVITGPNASGKTTFIKTALLNVLLSQQIGAGFYAAAKINPYKTLSCYINIPDTSGRDSLFQAEARRCKEILDLLPKGRMLCIFDELFSGTNPQEATASTYAFLLYLLKHKTCNFVLTTHFVDVCAKIKTAADVKNVYMKTSFVDGAMHCHYEMLDGVSTVKGGLEVLKQLNYPTEIIDCAKNCD